MQRESFAVIQQQGWRFKALSLPLSHQLVVLSLKIQVSPYLPLFLLSGIPVGFLVLWPPLPRCPLFLALQPVGRSSPTLFLIAVTLPPPTSSYSFSLLPLPPRDPSLPSLSCAPRIFAHLKSFLPSTSLQPLLTAFSPEGDRALLLLPLCPAPVIVATVLALAPSPSGWWCTASLAFACSPSAGPLSWGVSGKTGTTLEIPLPHPFPVVRKKVCPFTEQVFWGTSTMPTRVS